MNSLYLCALGFAVINPFFSKKGYRVYLWMILIVLVYFSYHLKVTESMDLYRHIEEMELFHHMGLEWVLENRMDDNPLAKLFFYAFSTFENPKLLPAFSAFICYGSAFYILLKCGERFDLSKGQMNCLLLVFCLCFYYDHAVTNIRIYLCYALISYFVYNEIMEGRFKRVCWVVYIACCFMHYAALPFLLFRIVMQIKRKVSKSELFFFIIIAFAVLASEFIVPRLAKLGGVFVTLAGKSVAYQYYYVFGIWQFLSSLMRIICFSEIYRFLYREYKDGYQEEKSIMFYLSNLNVMLICLIGNYQLVYRTPNFFHYLFMVPMSMLMKLDTSKLRKDRQYMHSALKICLFLVTVFTIWYQVAFIYPSIDFEF